MSNDEIFQKVREVLVDALAVDEEDVTPDASLTADLGAESIDFLDIVFKLEQVFAIKIPQGELFPENVSQDARYVQGGKVTPEGMATLKARLPHADFARIPENPDIKRVADVFTVNSLVQFVSSKLAAKG
ncbi:MAG: acyl carrier protein [Phycisphaerales bacterium]|nr:acyl carrier protein [Planctomycetales bacterium]MCB9841595.1 acyl carrier protein [Phycisphaeraceae bacterium]